MPTEPLPTTLLEDRIEDWWRPLALDVTGERLLVRSRSARAFGRALALEHAVDAVAYAHGEVDAGPRVIGALRDAALGVDPAFARDVADPEPPALVAAALADLLAGEPEGDLATLVSLLVLSARYAGRAPAIEGMRLAEYAERQLEHRAASARTTPAFTPSPPAVELVAQSLADAATAGAGWLWASASQDPWLEIHSQILATLAARVDALAAAMAAESRVLRERLSQQTWVLESWCQTAEAAWHDVTPAARPLLAAIELAERTPGTAPAIDAQALMASVLTAAGTSLGTDAAEAVVAAGPFLDGRLPVAPDPLLFPVSTAVRHWREAGRRRGSGAGEGLDWASASWQDELAIAMQTYREALALRILGHG